MRLLFKYLVVIALFFAVCFSYGRDSHNSYIIKFKSETGANALLSKNPVLKNLKPVFSSFTNGYLKNKNSSLSAGQKDKLSGLSNYYILNIAEGYKSDSMLAILGKDPSVESISPNYIYHINKLPEEDQNNKKDALLRTEADSTAPNDSLYSEQWALQSIHAPEAWLKATGKGIIIGMIDTGIDFNHEDLKNQLWINPGEDINHDGKFEPWPDTVKIGGVTGDLNGKDDDGNGFTDDVIGYDFVDQSVFNIGDAKGYDPIPEDEMYHGTNVAGIMVAQRNNKSGICGLAYNAKIMTVRAFDMNGAAESDDIATAIVYAALNGAKVLNFSFGEYFSAPIVHDAVKFAASLGCIMAASSGNDNKDDQHYPSDYSEVISVGGSADGNKKYSMGNYGSIVDILAPGSNVISTNLRNKYKISSGTSFSAPYVAAAAAIMLEINPKLNKDEIEGIFKATATDIEDKGWDYRTSSGILNIGAAVNAALSDISISSPDNDQDFDKSRISSVNIIGTIETPLFNSYQIYLGEGIGSYSTGWKEITAPSFTQIRDSILAAIQLEQLRDTVYTVRILVNLKNYSTIEKRIHINVFSSETPLKILSLKTINIWKSGKRAVLVAGTTNFPATLSIRFAGEKNDTAEVTNFLDLTKYQSVVLENLVPGKEIEAEAIARRPNGLEARQKFKFTLEDINLNLGNFIKKDYELPMLYLNNNVADLYGDGKASFGAVDISTGSLETTRIYEFDKNKFIVKDTLNDTRIPVGYGDSNGDGIIEMFTKIYRNSVLYQGRSKGASLFTWVPFADTTNIIIADGMYDITKDGKPELFANSDTAMNVYTFSNGSYQLLGSTYIGDDFRTIGSLPGFAAGDFDGDGNIEFCHGNESRGNLFIYEYSNGNIHLENIDSTIRATGTQYITSADIDGDGKPEIIIMNSGSYQLFGDAENGDPVWNLRIVKATGKDNTYQTIWEDHVYGVREGSDYKNGIAAGNLDKSPGDEIVFSVFPDLYIFKWNNLKKQPELFWYYPYVFSNTAMIYDFDKNGVNEIGFTNFNSTVFYEAVPDTDKLVIPGGFDGWAVNEHTAHLFWQPVPNADFYEVYRVLFDGASVSLAPAAVTNTNSIDIDTLQNNTNYTFTVRAASVTKKESDFASPVDVFTHKPAEPLSVLVKDSLQLLIPYSGKMSESHGEPSDFILTSAIPLSKDIFPYSVNRANDTSLIITFFEPIAAGSYNLDIKSFPDYYRTPTQSRKLKFDVTPAQQPIPELYLSRLQVLSTGKIMIEFSEDIDSADVVNLKNFILKPLGKISLITLNSANPSQIFVEFDMGLSPIGALGKTYEITAKNINSKSGHKMTTGAGNTLAFVFVEDNLENAFVYPNPIRYNENPHIYFANLTPTAEIEVISMEGEVLAEVRENDGNGGVEWDGLNKKGERLESGVYLFKVSGKDKNGKDVEEVLKKFVVIR